MARKSWDGVDPFLEWIELRPEEGANLDAYPFNLPAVKALDGFKFSPTVTIFVGENGSGKSTVIEAIAEAAGMNPEGGSRNLLMQTYGTHSRLGQSIWLKRGNRRPFADYFLRAESFYNVAAYTDRELKLSYGDKKLHEQSHGESFLALLKNRFLPDGLYILDEPESALSPMRQFSTVILLSRLVTQGCQIVMATHSPILMAIPGAKVVEVTESGFTEIDYRESEHFQMLKLFVENPERMLKALADQE